MSGETTYLRNPDVAIRDEDDSGSMLFNPDTGEVLVINDTGRFIWSLCAEPTTVDRIVKQFPEEYDDIPENLSEEVEQFVKAMTEGGFIASK
jgi:hypothetical protein